MTTGVVIFYQDELEYTKTCVTTLLETVSETVPVVLINNNSEKPLDLEDDLRVLHIQNAECYSFSHLCNQAIGHMFAENWDAVAICNNDLVFTPDWLSPLKKVLEEEQDLGVISPEVLALGHPERAGERSANYKDVAKSFIEDNKERHGSVHQLFSGACFLLRREAVLDVGLWDEKFKRVYWEDVDYMRRVLTTNWNAVICYGSAIFHYGGVTSGKGDNYYEENKRYFESKWHMTLPEVFTVRYCRLYDSLGALL